MFLIPPLPQDSLIAVVAPAGPAQPDALARLPDLYARFGFRVRIYPGCHATCASELGGGADYLAGDDATRLADLHAALAAPDVAAIHCMRGGYGAMRLLPEIDTALVRSARKLLIGYSDITALHALWCREGLVSLHAPMPTSDHLKAGREADTEALFKLLQQGHAAGSTWQPALLPGPSLRIAGSATGRLVGGNLSLVAALLGTPFAWPAHGSILFLEDINEDAHRVDRLLTQLRLAGVLDAVAGFVLGSFTEGDRPLGPLQQMLAPLGKPTLGGWPAGHGTPNLPLPLGAQVRLEVSADIAQSSSLSWLDS